MTYLSRKAKGIVVLACIYSLVVTGCVTQKIMGGGDLIQWRNLAEGKKEAAERNMPVLVDFFSGVHCIRCEVLVKTVYSDPEIAARINRDFVPVRINKNFIPTIEETILIGKMGSDGECALAFLDSLGNIVVDERGKQVCSMEKLSPEDFVQYMDTALTKMQK